MVDCGSDTTGAAQLKRESAREEGGMRFIVLVVSILLSSCAATYKQPTAAVPQTSFSVAGSKAEILRVTKRVLVTEGFQITNADDSAGVVSTAPRNLRVTSEQADCGTTMGIDYLKDNRTATRVGFGVIAEDGKVIVRTTIEGEYKPGAVDQNITLTCVSRGLLERDMLAKITAGISR